MAKNRMTFEKTQRENKKRQKAAQKRESRTARKERAKNGIEDVIEPDLDLDGEADSDPLAVE